MPFMPVSAVKCQHRKTDCSIQSTVLRYLLLTHIPCPFLMSHASVHRDSVKPRWICNTLAKCRKYPPPNGRQISILLSTPKKGVAIWTQLETSWMKYSATIKWWLKDRVGQSLQDCMWWWFRHDFAISIASDLKRCGCPWSFGSSDIIDTIDERLALMRNMKPQQEHQGSWFDELQRDGRCWSVRKVFQVHYKETNPDLCRIRVHVSRPMVHSRPTLYLTRLFPCWWYYYHSTIPWHDPRTGCPEERISMHSKCGANPIPGSKSNHCIFWCSWPMSTPEIQPGEEACASNKRSSTTVPSSTGSVVNTQGETPSWSASCPTWYEQKSFEKRFWMAVVFVGRFSHWRTWQMYKHIRWYNASLKDILTSYWQSWWRFRLHLQLGLLSLNEGHETENAIGRQGEGPQNQPPMKLAQKNHALFWVLVWYHSAGSAMYPTACFSSFYLQGANQQKSISLRIGCCVDLPFSKWRA